MQNVRLAISTRWRGDRRVHFPLPLRARQHVRTACAELAARSLQPVIGRTFDLDDIVDAYKYVETETKTGNVVLRVETAHEDAG